MMEQSQPHLCLTLQYYLQQGNDCIVCVKKRVIEYLNCGFLVQLGELDVGGFTGSNRVVSNNLSGCLFKSQNNRTWTPVPIRRFKIYYT